MQLRVLMVCKALPQSYKGGIQTHVWELSEALGRLGVAVHILTSGGLLRGERHRDIGGRHLIYLPTLPGHRLPLLSNTLSELSFNLQVNRWLRAHQHAYDVIHLQGRSGILWPVQHPEAAHRCVATVHGLAQEEGAFRRDSLDARLHTRLSGRAERQALARVGQVIAVSEDQRRRIARHTGLDPAAIGVISNGVWADEAVPHTARTSQIAFVGRIEPVKGVDLLPPMLADLPADLRLVMIGSGQRHRLEGAFRAWGVADRVVWTGDLDHDAVLAWLAAVRALVLPSRYEPQGRVVLEAMSQGCPVVASDTGGIPEMMRHGVEGLLVPPGDATLLASAVRRLAEHPEMAAAMGRRGVQRATDLYDWRHIARQTLAVYERVSRPQAIAV
ncbi:MAG: glycosyltransferase family 4 protein [Bacteroidia bacterium]